METLAVEVLSGLTILCVALAIWFLSSKQTRKSVGNSVQESAQNVEQALKISRAQAYAEAKSELGDIHAMLKESNAFLGEK